MPAFKDLLSTLQTDLSTQTADAGTLAAAEAAKTNSDAAVAASTVAFASAVHQAKGSFVVDYTATPIVLYTSGDGQTFTYQEVSGIGDEVPVPAPDNPPAIT